MTPSMLIDLLGSFRAAVRRLSALFGVGVVLGVLCVALLTLALLDWTFHLSAFWRLLLLGGAAGALGVAVLRHLIRPMRSSLPVTDIAGRIERRFPEFQDRLRSAVGFIQQPTPDSPAMQRSTIEQAVNLASTLPLRNVIDARPALRSLGIGLGLVLAIVLGLVLLEGATRSILFARVFNPFTQKQWPRSVQITMAAPIAGRVPAGGRVDVQVRLARGDSAKMRPIVYYENEAGVVRQEFLTRAEDGRYTASLDARVESQTRGGSMKIWIAAGDDETPPARVEVVPRLAIEAFDASVAAPSYAKNLAPTAFSLLAQQAGGLVGSAVDLTLKFSKPIASPEGVRLIALGDEPIPAIAWTALDDRTIRGSLRLTQSIKFRVDATDVDGFPAATSEPYELVARPDQLPSVFIENPRGNEDRTPDATIPLAGLLEDDVGVQDAALVVTRVNASGQTWTLPLVANAAVAPSAEALRLMPLDDGSGRSRQRVEYSWTLANLPDAKLKSGDVLEYFLKVDDNYELDGQRHPSVESAKLRITVISQEEYANRVTDGLRQVKSQLEQVKQQHDRTTAETESFAKDVQGKPELDTADASVATRLQQQQGSVASASRGLADRLQNLRREMDENKSASTDLAQMAKDVADRLGQTVEGSMKEAMQQLAASAQKAGDAAARQGTLGKTDESQKRASAELADALRKLDDVGSLNAAIDGLQKLLDAQRELTAKTAELGARNAGKTPEQMSPQDRAQAKALAAEQAKQADATAKAMDRLGKTADSLAKSDPASAAAMKAAQSQGKSANVPQSQSQASQQIAQNQQKNAKQAQQQAEAGLTKMLGELREAQKRKLAELQKKLAELQAQIDILVRRQSGHNLDNLTLRGGEALAGQEKLVTELTTKSGRKPGEAKPELGRLLSAQGQSERNARDIAKKASDVPDGAEPAARLTRAATLMERAAVHLRDKKLAEAYEPPQLDALSTLEEAKRLVDEQKQKVDDEIANQQREAIRQAYIRIRGEQEKIADETKRIENARNPQGGLNRADGVRLGQLPSEQGKLVDDVAKVGQNLIALKSTVYVWANQQISEGMTDVKASLASPRTDAGVQQREQQVLDDMQAMIDNLKVDPLERKFESAGGGGEGGGGGEKPLPPEAELRLMKALQQKVNVGTQKIADATKPQAKPDDKATATIVGLGRRQAQLRTLLGELMAKASGGGESPIGPEPKDAKPLPEEATLAQIDDQELQAELVGGKPGSKDKELDVRRVGDRMARSRSRLETERDAGRVTQVIQRRIVDDFDLLIEAARQQQCKPGAGGGKPSPQDVAQEPKPNDNQAQNSGKSNGQGGSQGAANSNGNGPDGGQANAGKDIRETAEEWGRISQRLRGPVLESRDEAIVERYRRLIEDYTQAVSTEASGGNAGATDTNNGGTK